MVNVKFVPADTFIEELSKYLKENVKEVKPPEWAYYTKTGSHKQRVPDDPDWWYKRCASIMRKLYIHGPVGIERLRTMYGGRKDMGTIREHFRKAGGAIIRHALQQLEAAGLVKKVKNGRTLTSKGVSLMDSIAARILRDMIKVNPELKKYVA